MRAEMHIIDDGGEPHVAQVFPAATQDWGKIIDVYVYDRPFKVGDPARLLFEWHEPTTE